MSSAVMNRRVFSVALAGSMSAMPFAYAAQFEPGKGMVQKPKQDFVPPPAGSYDLPAIQDAADGWVLEGNLVPRRLSRYTQGALTLLSFVYTYCTDPIGCPLAYETFVEVRERVLRDAALTARVRFVSLSFDPANDTPEAMQAYGGAFARDARMPWHFLTTYSLRQLQPILDGFGQDVDVEKDDAGRATRVITHMLKVFLIDERAKVREIYSAAFLQPEVIVNDLRTLAMASAARG